MAPINPAIGTQNQMPKQMYAPGENYVNNLTPQELMAMQRLAQNSQYQQQRRRSGLLVPIGGITLSGILGALAFAPQKLKNLNALFNLSADDFKKVTKERAEFSRIKEYFDNILNKNREFSEKYFANSELDISVDDFKNKAKDTLDSKTIERVTSTACDGRISKPAAESAYKQHLIEKISGDLEKQFKDVSKLLPKKRLLGAVIGLGITAGVGILAILFGTFFRRSPNK